MSSSLRLLRDFRRGGLVSNRLDNRPAGFASRRPLVTGERFHEAESRAGSPSGRYYEADFEGSRPLGEQLGDLPLPQLRLALPKIKHMRGRGPNFLARVREPKIFVSAGWSRRI
jgi:hypothetical protein